MNEFIVKGHQKLRCGYTTGSCAAAAAKAAVLMLLQQKAVDTISLMTPKGLLLELNVLEGTFTKDSALCGIKKDSGDDPDVTNGIMVYAHVQAHKEQSICIDGGEGVGRITKKGLEQQIGEAAINKVPRAMIKSAVEEVLEEYDNPFGIKVMISIPEGIEIAKRTFNPRLGIEGGISILGTTGIVEPMSEDALKDTIHLEIRMQRASGRKIFLTTPGNYGEEFIRDSLGVHLEDVVKCSNYIGDTLDLAVIESMEGVVFVGHIGKLVKVAGGIMNTHSKYGDCRMEILAAYATMVGGSHDLLRKIINSITTEEAVEYIEEEGLLEKTMELLLERMIYHLDKRAQGKLKLGVITFSTKHGLLGKSNGVEELIWYIL